MEMMMNSCFHSDRSIEVLGFSHSEGERGETQRERENWESEILEIAECGSAKRFPPSSLIGCPGIRGAVKKVPFSREDWTRPAGKGM